MLSFFGNNVAVVMSPYQDYCLQSCSGIFFFELRNSSAEAREGVGIREDFLPRIKIQYMFFFLWERDTSFIPEEIFLEIWQRKECNICAGALGN